MRWSHWAEYVAIRVLEITVRYLPLGSVRWAGRCAGTSVYVIAASRRRVALSNLRNAYPGLDAKDISAIARQAFASVGTTLFEFLRFPTFTPDDIRDRCSVDNPGLVEAVLARGRGVIFLTAHLGSWEWTAQIAGMLGGPNGLVMMKEQANPLVARLIDSWRSRFGCRTIASYGNLKEVVTCLRGGGWVLLAADQAAPKESIAVPFFGREVPTYKGPASFAIHTGAPILLGCAIRRPDGEYTIRFEEIDTNGLRNDPDAAIDELTRRHVAATEHLIRSIPEQWMWMHRRWKHVD